MWYYVKGVILCKVLFYLFILAVASALPEEWADMKDNENIKVVSVPNTEKEYQDIENRFITELKTGSYAHRLNFNPNNAKVNKVNWPLDFVCMFEVVCWFQHCFFDIP